jgi:hypothetical protein
MAASFTDQVWSLREVLLFRVPPWRQLPTVENMVWGDDRSVKRLRCAQRQANRIARGAENTFGVLMTG